MKTLTFTAEITVEEDDNSFHGTKIDTEKALVRAIADIPSVIMFRVKDEEGKSYHGYRNGKSFLERKTDD